MKAEDVMAAFHKGQEKFKLVPSVGAYDRIISFCCSSSKVMSKITHRSIAFSMIGIV